MQDVFLSFCIATYNRVDYLVELIDTLLLINREDIEIVVSDNCSTDETRKRIENYSTKVSYYCNETPIPALSNMIHSVFLAKGKYCFYINDRDLVDISKMDDLINVLHQNEWSCLETTYMARKAPSMRLTSVNRGAKALSSFDILHHPTGMIFNGEFIRGNLKEESYKEYAEFSAYDFLFADLKCFSDAGHYDNGIWYERRGFKAKHLAASIPEESAYRLFFAPESRMAFAKKYYKYVVDIKAEQMGMNEEDRMMISLCLFRQISVLLLDYKIYYSKEEECLHYGIKKKFVSYSEMKMYLCLFEDMYIEMVNESKFSERNRKIFLTEIKYNRVRFCKNYFNYAFKCRIKGILKKSRYISEKFKIEY